jgi:hypothetical protein
MRILLVALLLAVPATVGLAGGCMPFGSFAADGFIGAGGATGEGGAGGSQDLNITTTAASGTGGGDGSGGHPAAAKSYTYLCGGSQPDCSPDPGSTECAPGGPGNMAGTSDAGAKLTCHLLASGDQVTAACGLAGEAGDGALCKQATDCQAGLGCGSTDVADLGVCRQYCCGDVEACPLDTYCTPTVVAEGGAQVPLCQPVTMCALLDDATWCPAGQACTIVREDGTTSCVEPGPGTEGGSCPCAAGYTCWNATNECLKLCHLQGGDECGTGTCQGGAKYPTGIGVCVPQSGQ